MARQLLAISVSFGLFILSAEGFRQNPKLDLRRDTDEDCVTPLILTHYIESGDIAEGRRLARVPFTDQLNITSYSGYFTVDKDYDTNLFFWYFRAMSNASNAPVILFLEADLYNVPTLLGVFNENGPLIIKNDTLYEREYHWALDHHLIYIDSLPQVGFSFTSNLTGYSRGQFSIGKHLYSSIIQFFQIFPELQDNKFYVAGEAYGGKFAATLAENIHKNNPTAALKINLKGLAIINGWIDPENQLVIENYWTQLGFLDWNNKKEVKFFVYEILRYIRNGEFDKAQVQYAATVFLYYYRFVGLDSLNNYNQIGTDDFTLEPIAPSNFIRKGLHVGHQQFVYHDVNVFNFFASDFMKSLAPIISDLLEHYDVLIYSGQLDVYMGYTLTVNYLRHLNFSGSEEYETAKRHIWRVDGEVAGYVKTAGRLVEALVRNAGHLVSKDQPKWASDLITRFTYGKPFYGTD